jgi:hypothetical protein
MEYTTEALTKVMRYRRDESMKLEYKRQLNKAYEEGKLDEMIDKGGKLIYDGGAIDLAYSVVLNEIDRELGSLQLREYITEDIRDDVMFNIE